MLNAPLHPLRRKLEVSPFPGWVGGWVQWEHRREDRTASVCGLPTACGKGDRLLCLGSKASTGRWRRGSCPGGKVPPQAAPGMRWARGGASGATR